MSWSAIVLAAGEGRRFGSSQGPKQFLPVAGKPLVYHSLHLFETYGSFSEIVLVVGNNHREFAEKEIIDKNGLGKQTRLSVVLGGRERGDSVFAGLQAIQQSKFVAIHDGARPFLTRGLLERLIKTTEQSGGAIPGFPVQDTIKRCKRESRVIQETINRKGLWSVQTPQCFRYKIIREAYERALEEGIYDTDDAALVERLGIGVQIVISDAHNWKVTYPEDMMLVESFLEKRDV